LAKKTGAELCLRVTRTVVSCSYPAASLALSNRLGVGRDESHSGTLAHAVRAGLAVDRARGTGIMRWVVRSRGRTIIRRLDTSDTRNELTIELRNVVREYRVGGQSVRALDEISLRLEGGQFVSVVGPSGAGKSTLLHLLGALDSPDSG